MGRLQLRTAASGDEKLEVRKLACSKCARDEQSIAYGWQPLLTQFDAHAAATAMIQTLQYAIHARKERMQRANASSSACLRGLLCAACELLVSPQQALICVEAIGFSLIESINPMTEASTSWLEAGLLAHFCSASETDPITA